MQEKIIFFYRVHAASGRIDKNRRERYICRQRQVIGTESRIYIMNTHALTVSSDLTASLPAYRRDAIARFALEKDKKLSVGAGLLLQKACADAGAEGEDRAVDFLPGGKPVLHNRPDVHFSLSHSGEIAVCAISESNVGCDIESVGKFRELLAKKICSPAELEYLYSLDENERAGGFTRLWTLKESYMKFTGDGLSAGADRIGFILTPSGAKLPGRGELSFFEYAVDCGYRCSLCIEGTVMPELTEYAP